MQNHLVTLLLGKNVPERRSSRAICGSTKDARDVRFLALSRGTTFPHWEHWIVAPRPVEPLLRPPLFRFDGKLQSSRWLTAVVVSY